MHFAFLPTSRWKALNLLVSMIMLFQSKRLRTRTNCPTVHLTHQLHLNHFEESNLDPTLVSSTSMPAQSQGSQKTKQCWQCYGDQSHLRTLWLWRYRELGSKMKDLSRLKDQPRLFKLSKSCLFVWDSRPGWENSQNTSNHSVHSKWVPSKEIPKGNFPNAT